MGHGIVTDDLFTATAARIAAQTGRPIADEVADLLAPPPPPPPEVLAALKARGVREDILDRITAGNAAYLEGLRELARSLANASEDGTVTIDDVREAVRDLHLPMPREVRIDERVFGVVFRGAGFEALGQRPTRRAERIARAGAGASHITVYRLAVPA